MATVEANEIPLAPYYVVSTDRFMSGWGVAEGKTNRCVVPCESWDQAARVLAYVKTRSEQKRVAILTRRPTARKGVLYSVVLGWIEQGEKMAMQET